MPMKNSDEESGSGMGDELETERDAAVERRRSRDHGYTLTEVLAAVALMSIAIVPIILAAGVSIKASSQTRDLSRMETVLANAADRVNRATEGCDYLIYAQAATLSEWNDKTLATLTYQHYEPAASASTPGQWKPDACVDGIRTPGLVQMVTIKITSPDHKHTRTIQVVKSDV